MIDIIIDKGLLQNIPRLNLGILQSKVIFKPKDENLWEEVCAKVHQLNTEMTAESILNSQTIIDIRKGYKSIGSDPTRHRCSAEALVRRVIQGKSLFQINNIVDINNLVSLESFLPIGSYDCEKIKTSIFMRIGYREENYKGIGKDKINLFCLPVFTDFEGPFGGPSNDSSRTMITEKTESILMIIISFSGSQILLPYMERITELLTLYAGANRQDIEMKII